jgi:putative Mg2+ transporter-C (MgtC) family protein
MEMPLLQLLEFLGRVLFAALLGGLVGWEREHIARPAGLRTHMLVCVGSALVMVVSAALAARGDANVDVTRIGAQVVSGIGFLGAGTIIKEGPSVKGLTTAASLWAISCVGIAVGAGFYLLSAATTFALLGVLRLMHRAENKLKNRSFTYVVEADPSVFDSRSFTGFLDQAGYHIQELRLVEKHTGDRLRMQVEVRFPNDRASRDTRRSEFETTLQGYHAVCNVYDA